MFDLFTALADFVTYGLLKLDKASHFAASLHFFIEDTAKIFFLLFIVIFLMGFLRSMMSPERVRKLVGGKTRWVSYPLAVSLGAVTPFCSCSSVPLFIGFLEAGIPLGVTMAFLISSPMINEIGFIVLASVVGWKIAVLYVFTGLVVGIAGGLMIDALKMEKYVEEYVWKIKIGESQIEAGELSFKDRLGYAKSQVKEILGRIWKYVFIGIGIGAFLHGYVPQDFLLKYASADNVFSVPIAVLAGIPVYSSHTGVIPVAEALLNKGVPVGTVLALMMSVAAISLPEMIMLRKVLLPRLIGVFMLILFVCFIMVGYLFNAIVI